MSYYKASGHSTEGRIHYSPQLNPAQIEFGKESVTEIKYLLKYPCYLAGSHTSRASYLTLSQKRGEISQQT